MKNTLKYWGYVAKRTFLDGLPVVAGLLVAAIIFMALVHQDKAYPQEAEIFTYANPSLCTSVNRLAKELKELGFTPLMTAVNKMKMAEASGLSSGSIWIQKIFLLQRLMLKTWPAW